MRPEDLVKVVPGLPLSQARRVSVAEGPCFPRLSGRCMMEATGVGRGYHAPRNAEQCPEGLEGDQ